MSVLTLLWLGCAEALNEESRFWVVEIDPADESEMLIAVSPVLVRFSGVPDLDRCNTDTMRLDAIRDDDSVSFNIPLSFDATADGFVRFIHTSPLPGGWRYAVTVRGGDSGCADEAGTPVDPFLSVFEVP
jgi:hypothetical protein